MYRFKPLLKSLFEKRGFSIIALIERSSMNENKTAKVAIVKEISEKIAKSEGFVVAKYDGLSVKEFQTLRLLLAEKDVDIKVYKNRLFRIAAKDAGFEALSDSLKGANVFAFGMSDDISPAKVLAEFAKDHKALELKSGTFEGKVVDKAGIEEVATLPTLEEALTMLATQLLSPVKFVGVGLHQLIEGDHLGAAPAEETKSEEVKEEIKEETAPAPEAKAEEGDQ